MLYLPKGEIIFNMLPVNSVSMVELLDEEENYDRLIEVHTFKSANAFIAKGKEIVYGFEFTEEMLHLGDLSISKISEYIKNNPSKITTSKLTNELSKFYSDLMIVFPKYRNLDTRYFSLWRFSDVIAEEGLSGYISVQFTGGTLWSAYSDGVNTGGYLVLEKNGRTERLSTKGVLEQSAKLVGRIDFHQLTRKEKFNIDRNSVLSRSKSFFEIIDTDSQPQRRIIKQFGEMGIEIAMCFDGKRSIEKIAKETREPEERVLSLAGFLIQLKILEMVI